MIQAEGVNVEPVVTVEAVDIKTGKQVWETKVTDFKTQSASTSGGPIIAAPPGLTSSGKSVPSMPKTQSAGRVDTSAAGRRSSTTAGSAT